MAEFLSAGIFIEELPSSNQTVQEVSSSSMGIVGFSPRGPTNEARLVGSWDEYVSVFGGMSRKSLMGHQTYAFYQNSGRRCYVTRVTPSDAVLADCRLQINVVDQQIEQALVAGAAVSYSATAAASTLLDHGSLSPLVKGVTTSGVVTRVGPAIRYRATNLAVIAGTYCRQRDGSTVLQTDGVATRVEGRIDQKATYLHAGGGGPNGDLFFRSVDDNRTDITISITAGVVPDPTITVTGANIAIVANIGVHTCANILTQYNLSAAALALATLSVPTAGNAVALLVTNLRGVPAYDPELAQIVPNTLIITFQRGGGPITIDFAGVSTSPIQTKTNGTSDTATIDLRTGRFSLLLSAPGTAANNVTCVYTPASPTITLSTGTTINTGAGHEGKVQLTSDVSGVLDPGAAYPANQYLNLHDGAWSFQTVAADATKRPHALARILCTYEINGWQAYPISKGIWGNDLKITVTGNADWYGRVEDSAGVVQTTGAGVVGCYGRYDVTVYLKNSATLQYEPKERFEECNFSYSTNPSYFPDVVNENSDYVRITDPGSDEVPRQLNGFARTCVLAGGGGTGTTLTTLVNTTFISPVAIQPRTLTITYTRASDGMSRTITDDGSGNLTGDVDPTYVTASTSGLAANSVNYTTGEVNVRILSHVTGGTLITATYNVVPTATSLSETFSNTAKAYSYVYPVGTTISMFTLGTDGTFTSAYWSRSQFTSPALQASYAGMYAFDKVDDILQIVIPDWAGDATIALDQINYAESRVALPGGGDRFILLTPPVGSTPTEAVEWVQYSLGTFSKYAAVYWPWVRISDPLNNNQQTTVPNLGYVAGIYARTDATKNVGKAPAGVVDGQIRGVIGLEYEPSQNDRDYVYPRRVNPLIRTTRTGTAVWGCRTLAATSEWKYVNAVRLFMYCEKSVYESTWWVCFENNGPALWSRITTQLNGFFSNLFSGGYFRGATPQEAYGVICDDTNNSDASINLGQVVVDISLAPNKPAEYVRFRFSQRSLG